MRSPADSSGGGLAASTRTDSEISRAAPASVRRRRRLRIGLERAAHLIALLLIALLVSHALYAQRVRPSLRAGELEVGTALARWSTAENPQRVHASFDSLPTPNVRDWLAALPGAGTKVGWDGETPAPSAVSVEPVADPRSPSRVWVATPPGAHVQLSDELGAVDSTSVDGHGAVFVLPRLEGRIRATLDGQVLATNALRDSVAIKSALVVGMAGWEGKFIAAALEEHGWEVHARFALAPSGDVVQGPAQVRLDTARYSFVVAMDSVIRRYADQLPRYVRRGGGLIVLGEASSVPQLRSLLPALWGHPTRPVDFRFETADDPRRSFALGDLYNLKTEAIALEMRDDFVAVAGWRVGEGRVIQIGYLDTWRWRMAGLGEDAVEDHRLWWAALASGVAHAARYHRTVTEEVEPTPRATLIETIGDPAPAELELVSILDDPRLPPVLFGAAVSLLFLGWTSRRLRGAA